MPVELALWRIDGGLRRLTSSYLHDEARLERLLLGDVSILGLDLLVIGHQVPTAFGHRVDLLAINRQGDVCAIELKRGRTPRDVVAQLLDYGCWVKDLTYEKIVSIYSENPSNPPFEQAFSDVFGQPPPDTLNENHQLIIVASELDNATERIVMYLCKNYGVPINAIFFRYFEDESHQYLARTWLIDPNEADARPERGKETWNGKDFYVSLGEGESRSWEDCREYGFISGGGGRWYSRTLDMLFLGARVFVCIPNKGYVGVGVVKERSQRVRDFTVDVDARSIPILQAPLRASAMGSDADDEELSEYLVRVEWLKALPREQAIWEKGMFANQNTVCKLRNKFTLDRLVERFGLAELPEG